MLPLLLSYRRKDTSKPRSTIKTIPIDDNFHELLQAKQIVLVLLFPKGFQPFAKEINVVSNVYDHFKDRITFIHVDTGDKQDFSFIPQDIKTGILIYVDGDHVGTYSGRWSESQIERLCQRIIDPNKGITHIGTIQKYATMRKKHPVCIFLFGDVNHNVTKRLLRAVHRVNVIIPIGQITSSVVARSLGTDIQTPHLLISRPLDNIFIELDKPNQQEIASRITPFIKPVYYEETFGQVLSDRLVIGAIVSQDSEKEISIVSEIFHHCALLFKSEVTYQLCTENICQEYKKKTGRGNEDLPTFVAFKNGRKVFYRSHKINKEAIRQWIKSMKDKDKSYFDKGYIVPMFNREDYVTSLYRKGTLILLVGDSTNKNYKKAYDVFKFKAERNKNLSKKYYTYTPPLEETQNEDQLRNVPKNKLAYMYVREFNTSKIHLIKSDTKKEFLAFCKENKI